MRLILASPSHTCMTNSHTLCLAHTHTSIFFRFWLSLFVSPSVDILSPSRSSSSQRHPNECRIQCLYVCVCVCVSVGVMVWRGRSQMLNNRSVFLAAVCECDRVQSSVGVLSAAAMQRLSGLDRALWLIATTLIG